MQLDDIKKAIDTLEEMYEHNNTTLNKFGIKIFPDKTEERKANLLLLLEIISANQIESEASRKLVGKLKKDLEQAEDKLKNLKQKESNNNTEIIIRPFSSRGDKIIIDDVKTKINGITPSAKKLKQEQFIYILQDRLKDVTTIAWQQNRIKDITTMAWHYKKMHSNLSQEFDSFKEKLKTELELGNIDISNANIVLGNVIHKFLDYKHYIAKSNLLEKEVKKLKKKLKKYKTKKTSLNKTHGFVV